VSERWRATAVAGHAGDVDTARAGLGDVDPVVRELALGALDRLGVLSDAQVSAALGDPDERVRRRAATLAARRPGVALLGSLSDASAAVAETAAWACGERPADDAVLDRLVALAGSADDALVRDAAVTALGALGDGRGLPAILAGCSDKPAVRRRAVLALAPFDGPDVEAALDVALTDRDWQVRQAAEDLRRA
jgi:HEAT repeat protein